MLEGRGSPVARDETGVSAEQSLRGTGLIPSRLLRTKHAYPRCWRLGTFDLCPCGPMQLSLGENRSRRR
jgi:hypothetical protein